MSKLVIDRIDRKILSILQSNAHATSEQLSEEVGRSPSPSARRVRNPEATGVIRSYVAVVDQVKVGLPISVFVSSIKLESQREEELDRFATAVQRWPQIVDVLPDDRPTRLSVADRGEGPGSLRSLPQAHAHQARRRRLDRIELRAGAGEARAAAADRFVQRRT